jgi:hypothetical protein
MNRTMFVSSLVGLITGHAVLGWYGLGDPRPAHLVTVALFYTAFWVMASKAISMWTKRDAPAPIDKLPETGH